MHASNFIDNWLGLSKKSFQRPPEITEQSIACDCSGFINLLCQSLNIEQPWRLAQPKAAHYFGLLQEIGSHRISDLKKGHLLAWRKDKLPQSGDTGHVLWVDGSPRQLSNGLYQLVVVDSCKLQGGLSRRCIELQCDGQNIIGVRFHAGESKIKRTAIYHHPLQAQRYCFGCSLPKKVCQCGQITPIEKAPNVVVFRHPKERRRTLSTVSLIKQRYPSVLVKDGETFAAAGYPNAALLYPDQAVSVKAQRDHHSMLILLDGTWRKVKKMLHLNPWLLQLPRVSLAPEQPSGYLLRKVSDAHALSSAEAFALAQSDTALYDALPQLMERQIALMGRDRYRKNYQNHINYDPSK